MGKPMAAYQSRFQNENEANGPPSSLHVFDQRFYHSHERPVEKRTKEVRNTVLEDVRVDLLLSQELDRVHEQRWGEKQESLGLR